MLQQQLPLQNDIQRSLDRLQVFLNTNNTSQIIPAFYYSTDLLKRYASEVGPDRVNYAYFREFKGQLQSFASRDIRGIKQHQKQILEEMQEILQSDLFTQCLKPEVRSSHIKYRKQQPNKGMLMSQQKRVENLPINTPHHTQNQNVINPTISHQPSNNHDVLYNKLLTAYKQHRIDQAFALKNQYIQKGYPVDSNKNEFFNTVDLQYNTMISFYKQFDLQGWVFDKQENGVTLQYKIYQQEKQIAIRITGQFDIPVQNFLAILSEVDLMEAYIPFTYDSKELKVISRNEKIGTSKIYIPCLTDRQTYFYAAGYDRMRVNGSVFLYSKTINEDKVYQEKYKFKVPQASNYVRLEYKFFIVQYIPITRTRARVRLASKVDMKLNYLPQFILNMSARKFAFDYFKNIIKMNKNFKNSPWEKKIKQNPQFYAFFKRQVQSYMGKS